MRRYGQTDTAITNLPDAVVKWFAIKRGWINLSARNLPVLPKIGPIFRGLFRPALE
jgi:hypothetical protein